MHTWNCSKARVKLTTAAADENTEFGWSYVADLPADSFRPVYLTSNNTSERYFRPHTEWIVEGESILTNYDEVWLMYIKKPTPTEMDSLFTKAFYTLLASNLAMPITGKREIKRELYDEFLNADYRKA
jgi:hypothetical protein